MVAWPHSPPRLAPQNFSLRHAKAFMHVAHRYMVPRFLLSAQRVPVPRWAWLSWDVDPVPRISRQVPQSSLSSPAPMDAPVGTAPASHQAA